MCLAALIMHTMAINSNNNRKYRENTQKYLKNNKRNDIDNMFEQREIRKARFGALNFNQQLLVEIWVWSEWWWWCKRDQTNKLFAHTNDCCYVVSCSIFTSICLCMCCMQWAGDQPTAAAITATICMLSLFALAFLIFTCVAFLYRHIARGRTRIPSAINKHLQASQLTPQSAPLA